MSRNFLLSPLVLGTGFFGLCGSLHAQTSTWSGAVDGSWSNASNWTGGVPASSTTTAVVFGTGTTLATTQNISGGLTLNSLAFTAAAGIYTVAGTQPLIFSGTAPSISSFSTAAGAITVSVPLQFPQTVTVTGDAGDFVGFLRLSGIISGAGGLQWSSGIGSISGANTYTGGSTISGGAFTISNAASLGTGAVVINGGSLQLQQSGLFSLEIVRPLTISGTGAEGVPALHSASGSTFWRSAVTLAGAATIGSFKGPSATSSSLRVSGSVGLAGNTLTVDARTDSSTEVSGLISGAGGLIKTGAGTLTLSNNGNSFTGNTRVEAGTLALGFDSLGNIANTLTVVAGSTLQNTNFSAGRSVILEGTGFVNATGASMAGNISGPGGLKVTSGFVELSGTNTFSGGLTVGIGSGSAGLDVTDTVAFGAASNTVTLDAARINFRPTAASFSLNASQALTLGAGGATFGAATNKTITVAGDLSGAGKLILRGLTDNVDGGTFVISGNNTFAGGVLVSRTTLRIGADASLGGTAGPLDITDGTLRATASFAIAGTRSSTFDRNAEIDTQAFNLTFGQPILGSGRLIKTGSGTLALNAAGSSTAPTLLQAGSITTSAVNALGTGGVGLSSGTTLSLGASQELDSIDGSGNIVTLPGSTLTLTGQSHFFGGSLTGGALIILTGTGASYAPPTTPDSSFSLDGGRVLAMNSVTLDAARTIGITTSGGRLAAIDGETLAVNGVISGPGGLTIQSLNSDFSITGDGVVALNSTNTYSGGTTIPVGVLVAGADGALGLGAVTLNGGTLSAAGARTFSQPLTLGTPAGFGQSELSGDTMTFSGDWTLTGDRSLAVKNLTTLAGALVGGSFNFTKLGNGTLTLNGTSNHSGITTVQQGTLAGTGSLGPIAVSSGATLAPGSSSGTLRTGNVTFQGSSTLALDYSSPAAADQLAVTGSVTLNGNVELAPVLTYTPTTGTTLVIIDNDGSDPINTSGGLFTSGGTPLTEGASFQSGGASWTISYIGGTGNDVTLSPTLTTPPSLLMTSFSIANPAGGASGKQVQGTISGSPGASIRLMRSAALIDWTLLETIVLDGSGQGNFDVVDPLATDRAFYSLFFP